MMNKNKNKNKKQSYPPNQPTNQPATTITYGSPSDSDLPLPEPEMPECVDEFWLAIEPLLPAAYLAPEPEAAVDGWAAPGPIPDSLSPPLGLTRLVSDAAATASASAAWQRYMAPRGTFSVRVMHHAPRDTRTQHSTAGAKVDTDR